MRPSYERRKIGLVAVLIVAITAFIITALFSTCSPAHASEIPENMAVHAVLGEARGEGYSGMYAVACAIRNRGTLRGVYGATADVSDADDDTKLKALTAWRRSAKGEDTTNGATHWENIKAYGTPYWARGKKPTAIVGRHRFFKVK